MWALLRETDWSTTCLGPIDAWPLTLRTILRTVMSTPQPICMWWGSDLLQFHNEAFLPILGKRAEGAFGAPFQMLWPDAWGVVEPYVKAALAGRGTGVEDLPIVMTRNGYPERTYWTFSYSPLYGDGGEVEGILNIVTETTRQVLARQAQSSRSEALELALGAANAEIGEQREQAVAREVVQRELSHRLKNAYAMVQAIVSQTMRRATSVPDAADLIASRIQALAAAQDILMRYGGDRGELSQVIHAALLPHQETVERIAVSGPPLLVSAQQVLGVALAMHELATNSAKYGSLSLDAGTASVAWACDGPNLRLSWRDIGGPPVAAPSRRGFGTRLLERVIPSYFAGTGRVDYLSDGLKYTLDGVIR